MLPYALRSCSKTAWADAVQHAPSPHVAVSAHGVESRFTSRCATAAPVATCFTTKLRQDSERFSKCLAFMPAAVANAKSTTKCKKSVSRPRTWFRTLSIRSRHWGLIFSTTDGRPVTADNLPIMSCHCLAAPCVIALPSTILRDRSASSLALLPSQPD